MNEQDTNLIERWKQGDQQAATELFERYAQRLIALARSRLPAHVQRRVDPEDVIQSVYRCFFADTREGLQYVQASRDLWQLLVFIVLRKVRDQIRNNRREKRAVQRERSLDQADCLDDFRDHLATNEPSPLEALALVDEVQTAMSGLKPLERQVVELRFQGYSLKYVANELQVSFATVRRTLKKVQEQLQRRFVEED